MKKAICKTSVILILVAMLALTISTSLVKANGNEGDVNGDGKVEGKDILLVFRAFNTVLGDPRWDPRADQNGDDKVDSIDLYIVIRNFGHRYT